ncbi:hypothetical protein ALC62_09522 [Cyphomyrmex costatus]|uniref:Uncharacterized protein n=1 Tax=Cyphomyrmex costatus TaxID=456900 RepID=A0A195CHJ4_9HYME|nr:hypothetical protein ALC62_09522 [Cyphomyrmex costatus]
MFVFRFPFEDETTRLTTSDSATPCDAAPRRTSAKPETQQAEVEREKRSVDKGEWKGGSSFGNSGTELVDESVGGYRRLSRRRATSNTEQEGSREEKRTVSKADRKTRQRRVQETKRERIEPGPPFLAPSSAPLVSYLFVTVSLVSHEPINIFFDSREARLSRLRDSARRLGKEENTKESGKGIVAVSPDHLWREKEEIRVAPICDDEWKPACAGCSFARPNRFTAFLSSGFLRELTISLVRLLSRIQKALPPRLSLPSRYKREYPVSLPCRPILVINFQVVQQRPCPTGPACGHASALHLHPVKCRKLVKARAVMCRIASRIAGRKEKRLTTVYNPAYPFTSSLKPQLDDGSVTSSADPKAEIARLRFN